MQSYKMMVILVNLLIILFSLWVYTFVGVRPQQEFPFDPFAVARSNLKLPSLLFFLIVSLFILKIKFEIKYKYSNFLIISGFLLISTFDLIRFSDKFNPFTKQEYFFPNTKAIEFLKSQEGVFRIASTNPEIMPPNFSTYYKLQSIEGYDPLYLRSYGELLTIYNRQIADTTPPFGFNRILTYHKADSEVFDILNVKYVLSFNDLNIPRFKKVFQEGQTKIYENLQVLPRAYFVKRTLVVDTQKKAAQTMLDPDFRPNTDAVINDPNFPENMNRDWSEGLVNIKKYTSNKVVMETQNNGEGFLVISDSYYPTWKVKIDSKQSKIYKANMNFRGVIVPKGKHKLEFYITLL